MSDRDTTVAGLIAKLQELVELNPAIAGYQVIMESSEPGAGYSGWRGSTFQYPAEGQLELECWS